MSYQQNQQNEGGGGGWGVERDKGDLGGTYLGVYTEEEWTNQQHGTLSGQPPSRWNVAVDDMIQVPLLNHLLILLFSQNKETFDHQGF